MKKKMILSLSITVAVVAIYFVLHPFAYLFTGKYQPNAHLEIVGHKGASGLAPENTLAAVRMGLEHAVDVIEIDIHMTADNEIVVCHDKTIDRTTTGSGEIRNLTLEEICNANIRVGDRMTDLKIPTLQEVISCVSEYPNVKLLIEFKYGNKPYPQIEQKVLDLLNANDIKERAVIQSFRDETLTAVHNLEPTIKLEKLFFFKLWGLPLIIDNRITYFSPEKYKHISSFNVLYDGLTQRQASKYRSMGKNLKVYTLESISFFYKMKGIPQRFDPNITGVITSRPDMWEKK